MIFSGQWSGFMRRLDEAIVYEVSYQLYLRKFGDRPTAEGRRQWAQPMLGDQPVPVTVSDRRSGAERDLRALRRALIGAAS